MGDTVFPIECEKIEEKYEYIIKGGYSKYYESSVKGTSVFRTIYVKKLSMRTRKY